MHHSTGLHPNHAFCLDTARVIAPGGRYLDYGCGAGDVVEAGLNDGLDIWGTDIFYGGGDGHLKVRERGLLDKRIFELRDNYIIPFPDQLFDVVFHNMVFEHVETLPPVLREIRRVLKPSGVMLSIFPTKEVWREGHCGIPFAHRLRSDSRVTYYYLHTMRRLGFGYFHGDKRPDVWAADFVEWLRSWCYYRTLDEIRSAYRDAGLSIENYETPYIMFRLQATQRAWAKPIVSMLPRTASVLLQRLATRVMLSRAIEMREAQIAE